MERTSNQIGDITVHVKKEFMSKKKTAMPAFNAAIKESAKLLKDPFSQSLSLNKYSSSRKQAILPTAVLTKFSSRTRTMRNKHNTDLNPGRIEDVPNMFVKEVEVESEFDNEGMKNRYNTHLVPVTRKRTRTANKLRSSAVNTDTLKNEPTALTNGSQTVHELNEIKLGSSIEMLGSKRSRHNVIVKPARPKSSFGPNFKSL